MMATQYQRDSLINVRGVSISRGGKQILDQVDMEIFAGEITTLIGQNGSGKSTLVKLLMGLEKPDSGSLYRRAGVKIGYMPQKLYIDDNLPLTVRKLMTLIRPARLADIVISLKKTGAGHLMDRRVHDLSGGELQRVLLARCFLSRPTLLILDEPVQGVDFAGVPAIYNLIRAIHNDLGCAILMVSHDLHLVMSATDRVVCLNHHICCQGTPDVVSNDPQYRALFGIGSHAVQNIPTPVLAPYIHHHNHVHGPDGCSLERTEIGRASCRERVYAPV